jgi:hypothetical protein
MSRPQTYDHIKSSKKPIIRKVFMPLDDEVAEAYQAADATYQTLKVRAELNIEDPKLVAKIVSELSEAEKERTKALEDLKKNSAVFKVRSIGRRAFDKLKQDNPPTTEQTERFKERGGQGDLEFDTESFPLSLLQKCIVEPQMTASQVREMWEGDDWSHAELLALFEAAYHANTQFRNINLGKG